MRAIQNVFSFFDVLYCVVFFKIVIYTCNVDIHWICYIVYLMSCTPSIYTNVHGSKALQVKILGRYGIDIIFERFNCLQYAAQHSMHAFSF